MTSVSKDDKPLVAICMATYNPPLQMFSTQIESIRNQTYPNWICIISDDCSAPNTLRQIGRIVGDDKRFSLTRAEHNLGFYNNFERCLSLVPKGADFVALSDQDDYWHPCKLQTLLSGFDGKTTLVYSDMNIVDEGGKLFAKTFWTGRRNNFRDLASLLMTNTITGSASMFRSSLLRYILPFPERIGNAYHDHWIGCVALAIGNIAYVDRPLLDYTQHPTQVLGYPSEPSLRKKPARLFRTFANARSVYLHYVLGIKLMAETLRIRCDRSLMKDKKRVLERLARMDESLNVSVWLAFRGLKSLRSVSETMGAEYALLAGIMWKRYANLKSRVAQKTALTDAVS